MGLPHVLVRFYTNPDGAAARRTTLVVLGLVGMFYLFPTLYGVLGRVYTPQLLMTGETDAVVLLLPGAALGGGLAGQLLGALVAAGAFAAFLSSASGLLTSVAGVLSTDVLGQGLGPRLPDRGRRGRRRAVVLALRRGQPGRLAGGRPGVRGGRVVVLPAAGARHLVARPDRCRRGGRHPGRGGAAALAVLLTVLGLTGHGLAGDPADPAGRLDRAAGVRRDGHRLAGHPPPRPRRRRLTMLRLHAPDTLRL